jgi:hypothetical protein
MAKDANHPFNFEFMVRLTLRLPGTPIAEQRSKVAAFPILASSTAFTSTGSATERE